jgi:hypothetical protein
MALKNDLCGIYPAGSYYGIRRVTEFLSLFFSYIVLLCIQFSISFSFFCDSRSEEWLRWHNLSVCPPPEAYLMFKYKIHLSLSWALQKTEGSPHSEVLSYSIWDKQCRFPYSNQKQYYTFQKMKVFQYAISRAWNMKLDRGRESTYNIFISTQCLRLCLNIINCMQLCKIWGFHSLQEWCLLGCYAVWLLKEPTFRRNLAPPSSGWQKSVH